MFKKRSPASRGELLLKEIELWLEAKRYKFSYGVRIHKEDHVIPDLYINKMNGTLFRVAIFVTRGMDTSPDKRAAFYSSINEYQVMGVRCFIMGHESDFDSKRQDRLERMLTHDSKKEYEMLKCTDEDEV